MSHVTINENAQARNVTHDTFLEERGNAYPTAFLRKKPLSGFTEVNTGDG